MSKTDKKTIAKTDNIEKMDFNQLRKTVQLLYDELSLFKRKYNDAIMNLDEDNFGKSLTFTQNNMKSQIKMNAQEISTKISADDVDGMLVNYSTITQTATQIQTAVVNINNATDKKLENYSTITQTADAITLSANSIRGDMTDLESNLQGQISTNQADIEIAADNIKMRVAKSVNYETATRDSAVPTYANTTAAEKKKLYFCTSNERYYYYNEISQSWAAVGSNNVYSAFIQTADGFEFSDLVKINGDLIVTGTISGDRIQGGAIKGTTVGTNDNIYGDGIRLNSDTNRLEVLYNGTVVGAWGYTTTPGGSAIYPAGGGTLTVSDVTASGTWDFSGCTDVTGLPPIVAVFG